uniref:Salt tolerance-like protein At1g75540 family n=2 Tax=Cajanus cajan TaxID=3821 RepID=A0A151RVK6_CAJCA|nr:putative salt tolerance-like protein At1g75540 family [Cajanus cajan]
MKIQCDVCNKNEASLFCTADEAALCDACDHRVHHANKLASKHQRFSLLRPSPSQHPVCDICQEKRAFTFCQQDRAILCKDCDVSIHSANEHTLKHDRFLLTAVKLSASAMLSSSEASSDSNSTPSSLPLSSDVSRQTTLPPSSTVNKVAAIVGTASTDAISSSISDYLIETLPGWQVEDFLDSYSVPFGFSKSDEVMTRFDGDVEGHVGSLSTESMGIWVPQAPPPLMCSSQMDRVIIGHAETNNVKGSRSRLKDDNFTVPQISPQSNSKRARFLW